MSPSEYQELTSFFVERLDRHQAETRALVAANHEETRVIVESLRHEIRLVADGVLTNTRAIEANGARIDVLTNRVERLETTVSVRFDDHEERLRVLESRRR